MRGGRRAGLIDRLALSACAGSKRHDLRGISDTHLDPLLGADGQVVPPALRTQDIGLAALLDAQLELVQGSPAIVNGTAEGR